MLFMCVVWRRCLKVCVGFIILLRCRGNVILVRFMFVFLKWF